MLDAHKGSIGWRFAFTASRIGGSPDAMHPDSGRACRYTVHIVPARVLNPQNQLLFGGQGISRRRIYAYLHVPLPVNITNALQRRDRRLFLGVGENMGYGTANITQFYLSFLFVILLVGAVSSYCKGLRARNVWAERRQLIPEEGPENRGALRCQAPEALHALSAQAFACQILATLQQGLSSAAA